VDCGAGKHGDSGGSRASSLTAVKDKSFQKEGVIRPLKKTERSRGVEKQRTSLSVLPAREVERGRKIVRTVDERRRAGTKRSHTKNGAGDRVGRPAEKASGYGEDSRDEMGKRRGREGRGLRCIRKLPARGESLKHRPMMKREEKGAIREG